MASRSGQKGTIGLVIPEADMPFTRDGIIPDIIINPHAIPTRMTIGHLVECITGKACAAMGCFGDATAFNNDGTKISQFGKTLVNNGFHSSGNDILYNGMTGEQIETEIFFGPTYYMRLKHMVKDKINYRSKGPRTALTRQPVSGRANDGGLRIGEMERDSIISHGATNFLTESMMERGDKYYMSVCNKTGMIAIYNPSKNLFMSPMADGPIKFIGSIAENNIKVENITKHGRSFSIVCIPYTLKLLIQELQCTNVALRLITDDNIEQIENMSFSKNIDLLLMKENVTVESVVNKLQLDVRKINRKTQIIEPEKIDFEGYIPPMQNTLEGSPPYATEGSLLLEGSPPYATEGSPVYNPNSPLYNPNSPPYPQEMNPNSPPYPQEMNPNSPPYPQEMNTNSPMYNPDEEKQTLIGGFKGQEYSIGQMISLRGGGGGGTSKNNIWKIQDITPEFTTVINDDELRVVDNNEISPYIQNEYQQPYNPAYNNNIGYNNNPVYDPMMQMPMIKPEVKTPDVNVVVITGDKNELNGLTQQKEISKNDAYTQDEMYKTDIKSGGNASNNESIKTESSSGSSILDFTKSFFIKKME